jgi:hypothetical protein
MIHFILATEAPQTVEKVQNFTEDIEEEVEEIEGKLVT